MENVASYVIKWLNWRYNTRNISFFSLSILNIYSELYKEKQAMSQGMYLLSLKHLAADSFKIVDEHLYKSAITIHWLFSIKNYIYFNFAFILSNIFSL